MSGDALPLDAYRHLLLTPFERLYERRIVFLRGPLEDAKADELVAELVGLDVHGDGDVTMFIDSPSDASHGMLAIHDTMQSMRSTVHTRCVGRAASAGAVLLASGTGTRSASPNARVMIHQPFGAVQGGAADIESQAEQISHLRQRVDEILAERTGQPVHKIHADTDRGSWMSAEEARAYGLVDEVS